MGRIFNTFPKEFLNRWQMVTDFQSFLCDDGKSPPVPLLLGICRSDPSNRVRYAAVNAITALFGAPQLRTFPVPLEDLAPPGLALKTHKFSSMTQVIATFIRLAHEVFVSFLSTDLMLGLRGLTDIIPMIPYHHLRPGMLSEVGRFLHPHIVQMCAELHEEAAKNTSTSRGVVNFLLALVSREKTIREAAGTVSLFFDALHPVIVGPCADLSRGKENGIESSSKVESPRLPHSNGKSHTHPWTPSVVGHPSAPATHSTSSSSAPSSFKKDKHLYTHSTIVTSSSIRSYSRISHTHSWRSSMIKKTPFSIDVLACATRGAQKYPDAINEAYIDVCAALLAHPDFRGRGLKMLECVPLERIKHGCVLESGGSEGGEEDSTMQLVKHVLGELLRADEDGVYSAAGIEYACKLVDVMELWPRYKDEVMAVLEQYPHLPAFLLAAPHDVRALHALLERAPTDPNALVALSECAKKDPPGSRWWCEKVMEWLPTHDVGDEKKQGIVCRALGYFAVLGPENEVRVALSVLTSVALGNDSTRTPVWKTQWNAYVSIGHLMTSPQVTVDMCNTCLPALATGMESENTKVRTIAARSCAKCILTIAIRKVFCSTR